MKKLIVSFGAIAVGILANAASYSWSASEGRLFDGIGSATSNRYEGMGYLFNADTVSQNAIIAAFISDAGVTATLESALTTGTFSGGRASVSDAFTGPNSAFSAYFVVLGQDADGNDAIYISDEVTANYQTVGESDVTFGQQNDYSSIGFKDAYAGYSSAGWYTAVPEPTSGLLMLLGVASLALKRKRA